MRRLLTLALLFCSTPTWASIAYVAASGTACATGTTATTGTACTLNASTTPGNDVVVGLSWNTTSNSINQITGNVAGSYFYVYSQGCNGSGSCSAIAVCINCAALNSVTPTFNGTTTYVLHVAEYSGVSWIGITGFTTGSSASPGLTMTTGDSNDWIVTEASVLSNAGVPTAGTGNLRKSNRNGTTSSYSGGALIDNTVASAGNVTATSTATSGAWSASGVELRTIAAKTYIWPDCDSAHPCVVHEKATVSLGTETNVLSSPLNVQVPPTLPGNLGILHISLPSGVTMGAPTDDKSNTWVGGSSTTDSENGVQTKTWYVCNMAAGTSKLQIPWTGTLGTSILAQITFKEVSGIAASACRDAGSGADGLQGTIHPGAFTTTASGDFVATMGVCASQSIENTNDNGMVQPDDKDAMVEQYVWNQWASEVQVQSAAGSTNPALYVNAQDPNNSGGVYWNVVSDAFKASSGAGTQPTGIHVITDMQWQNDLTLAWNPLPSAGNAIVLSTSNPVTGFAIAGLTDNLGEPFTAIAHSNDTLDPQIYYTCLGASNMQRDRIFSFTPAVNNTHIEIYTIGGAKSTGVSGGKGCKGNDTNTNVGTQNSVANSNIVGDPVFTAAINSGVNSVVIATSYVGTGPPSQMCITGGVAPPTCTGQSTNVVFNSIWAPGMGDDSGWSTGDPFIFYYTNSTNSKSLDYLMANGTGSTVYDGAAIEIEGQANNSIRRRAWVIGQ